MRMSLVRAGRRVMESSVAYRLHRRRCTSFRLNTARQKLRAKPGAVHRPDEIR